MAKLTTQTIKVYLLVLISGFISIDSCSVQHAMVCFHGIRLIPNITSLFNPENREGLCKLLRKLPQAVDCYTKAIADCNSEDLSGSLQSLPIDRFLSFGEHEASLCHPKSVCDVDRGRQCLDSFYHTYRHLETNMTVDDVVDKHITQRVACRHKSQIQDIKDCFQNYTKGCSEDDPKLVPVQAILKLVGNMDRVYNSLCYDRSCGDFRERRASLQNCSAALYEAQRIDKNVCDAFVDAMHCERALAYRCFALEQMKTLSPSMKSQYCKPTTPAPRRVVTTSPTMPAGQNALQEIWTESKAVPLDVRFLEVCGLILLWFTIVCAY